MIATEKHELELLRQFARDIMQDWPNRYPGYHEMTQIAERAGLLMAELHNEPCGPRCRCADLYVEGAFNRGVICYNRAGCIR